VSFIQVIAHLNLALANDSVVVKDLWLEDKDLRTVQGQGLEVKGQDLRSEDKNLSVYAKWTTAGTLFATKNKNRQTQN